ncbi:MAG: hypothetical protein M1823_002468 [Watsoniomyces obsoletus]|nr:MAG: hypothetical protein M1823_002468 [Watsoniomyces obsoletus]
MLPNIDPWSDGISGPNSTPPNAGSHHRDSDGNAGGNSFTDELIGYATDHENDDGSPDHGFPSPNTALPSVEQGPHQGSGTAGGITAIVLRGGADRGGNTEGGPVPACTCTVLDGIHRVEQECPLANNGKGGFASNTDGNTGGNDDDVRPTDGSGNTDGNPRDKTTFWADATISRLFDMVDMADQFIVTKANMPKDCGPPVGKPKRPNFNKDSQKTSIDVPCGHCDGGEAGAVSRRERVQ